MTDYFIPDIEDIRIGYEAEFDLKGINKEGWRFVKFKGVDEAVRCYYEKGLYRTPYLTKEQIEAEGWVEQHSVTSGRGMFTFYKKGNYLLEYNSLYKGITIREGSWYPEETKYSGECKDINTFRYICKLLKIK